MNIAVSGSTCVGKTTLINLLLSDKRFQNNGIAIFEHINTNTHICNQDERFQSQMFFYINYLDDLLHLPYDEKQIVFFDRTIEEHLLISKIRYDYGELTDSEYFMCDKIANCIKMLHPKIDKTIYLYCSSELAYKRQEMREPKVIYDINFLNKLNCIYKNWAEEQSNIFFVNTENPFDIDRIINFILT